MTATRQAVGYEVHGDGPVVLLVHSSVSGRRQWRSLTQLLAPRYRVVAVDLIGYGDTPPWHAQREQRLSDQAALLHAIAEEVGEPAAIVGHSFGASVALCAAATLGDRLRRLVLIEPNPFPILRDAAPAAYAEATALRATIQRSGDGIVTQEAAERFADYWNGAGTWAAMSHERQESFARALQPNYHEWDAVMSPTAADHVAAVTARTRVIAARDTTYSIAAVIATLERRRPDWQFTWIDSGGHMAALTRPDAINPLVAGALDEPAATAPRPDESG